MIRTLRIDRNVYTPTEYATPYLDLKSIKAGKTTRYAVMIKTPSWYIVAWVILVRSLTEPKSGVDPPARIS